MNNTTLLHNTGILIINKLEEIFDKKTIVVIGAPRGGTSMVAGVLYHLGIFMGNGLRATYEDNLLIEAVRNGQIKIIEDIIRQRNAKYDVWGWKQPVSFKYLFSNVTQKLRNPIYIFVFRDSFAVANRNRISVKADLISNMRATLQVYIDITDFLREVTSPCLLISYEKAISNKESFVNELSEFVGIRNPNKIKNAIEFIQPGSNKYLIEENPVDVAGVLDQVDQKFASGWAIFKHKLNEPVQVKLFINDKHQLFSEADNFRPDLLSAGIHPTGKCGFIFRFTEEIKLKPGDKINVYAGDYELRNSPKYYCLPK